MRKKQFTLEWFKEFGWLNNPFRLEILNPIDLYFTGYEKERQKLNYFIIENYPFGTIRAEKGAGKSMMLLWLKQSLQSYKGSILAVYYKAEKRSESLAEALVDNFTSMSDKLVVGSLFKLRLKKVYTKVKGKLKRKKEVPHSIEEMQQQQKQQKSIYEHLYHRKFTQFSDLHQFFEKKLKNERLVLLIDDAEKLSESDIKFVQDLMDSQLKTQVIIGMEKGEKNPFAAKDALKVNLGQLSYKEIQEMIKVRIKSVGGHGIRPFNEHMLHGIYNKGKKNPLHILKIAYDQAVKLSLKHLSDRKKGKLPEQKPPKEFDEAAEYRKLLEEERRRHKDPNDLILGVSFDKEKEAKKKKAKKKKENILSKKFIAEEPINTNRNKPLPPPSSKSSDYQIQVLESEGTTPIEIAMGGSDDGYEIKEVKKKKKRLASIPSSRKTTKKASSRKKSTTKKSTKKTRRKKSTRHHPARKKKATKKTTRKRSRKR